MASERWRALEANGARPQRLLWASTSTKIRTIQNALCDELIGPDTVNTIPGETFTAFRDGGRAEPRLTTNWEENLEDARTIIRTLAEVGVSLHAATDQLLDEGVRKFVDPFDTLLSSIERKRQTMLGSELSQQTYSLDGASTLIEASLKEWRTQGKVRRLWQKDPKLWSGKDEDQWLGWLDIVEAQRTNIRPLTQLAEEIKADDFQ